MMATFVRGMFCVIMSMAMINFNAGVAAQAAPDVCLDRIAGGLVRRALDNGLTLLVYEDASAPVVSVQILVGAGSAHEQEYLGGGLSHFIEHMIFKGTATRKPGDIAREIHDLGGIINAYTSIEQTVFLADLPARHWRAGLAVLADALLNASFPEDEWRREKDVILREMAMCNDSPERTIGRLALETVWREHPYRVPVIGYADVFKTLSRSDLLDFFRRHYLPENMILVVVGDVVAAEVEAEVSSLFDVASHRVRPLAVWPQEPPRLASCVVRKTGAYNVARAQWIWRTVPVSHADAAALDVLAAVVGRGRSARLPAEVRERLRLAHEISAFAFALKNDGLFGISAVFDAQNEAELSRTVADEVERWHSELFAADDVARARRQLLTETIEQLETMNGLARSLLNGEYYAGDAMFLRTSLRMLESVTPEDVRRVARLYLAEDKRVLVVLAPAAQGGAGAEDQKMADRANGKAAIVLPQKTMLANGLTLLTRPDHKLPFVHFCAVSPGGLLLEEEANNGITRLMAELLTRGTHKHSAPELARLTDERGGSLQPFSGQNSCGLRARCLTQDAGFFMELFADCLLNPVFDETEIEKQKQIQLAAIAQQMESPVFLAQEALRQALFPKHPYRFSPEGGAESVGAITRPALESMHERTFRNKIILAVFGDISAAEAQTLVERSFKRATFAQNFGLAAKPFESGVVARRDIRLAVPREQTIVLTGFPGVALNDRRMDALNVLEQAMSGLSSELFKRIRDRDGLAYFAGAYNRPGLEPGIFALYAGTRADAVARVQEHMRGEIERLTNAGLSQDEFERARRQLVSASQQRLQRVGDVALECALHELYGLGAQYGFETEARLDALTPEDVRRAAADLLAPELAIGIVVVPEERTSEHGASERKSDFVPMPNSLR